MNTTITPATEQANCLSIKQTYSVCGKTFDTEAQAQAYALMEKRKRQAVEILSRVRPYDARHLGAGMDNKAVVAVVANHLEAFAEIVALLQGVA